MALAFLFLGTMIIVYSQAPPSLLVLPSRRLKCHQSVLLRHRQSFVLECNAPIGETIERASRRQRRRIRKVVEGSGFFSVRCKNVKGDALTYRGGVDCAASSDEGAFPSASASAYETKPFSTVDLVPAHVANAQFS